MPVEILGDEESLFNEAKRLYKARRFGDCSSICYRILNAYPSSPNKRQVRHLLADTQSELGDWVSVVNEYTTLIGETQDDEVAFANRGYAYLQMQQFEHATSDYLRAVKLRPDDLVSVKWLALCYLEMKDPDAAIEIILNHVPSDSSYGSVFGVLGDAYCRKRRWFDAYKAFKLAVALDPTDQHSRSRMVDLEKLASE